ncbi:MAG: LysR family transcriptional regulator [Phascolarctobacterium sp.]|nr:LysR family transcriptional regulator [Phascolarctobacterium sp.]
MLLRQMKFFLMVADCKSFSEAANKAFMTQPAISHQIKMLEQDLGIALFERKNSRVSLTAAGEEFYEPCKRLVTQAECLRAHMQNFSAPPKNGLRIGSRTSYNVRQLCAATNKLNSEFPNSIIEIIYRDHDQLLELLQKHELDAVITDLRSQEEKELFIYKPLENSPVQVALPMSSCLAQNAYVEPEQLQKMNCILIAHKKYGEQEKAYYKRFLDFGGCFKITRDIPCAVTSVVHGHSFLPVVSNIDASAYYGQITKLVPLYHNGHPFNFEHGLFWNRGCLGEEQRELLQKLYSLLKI